MISVLFRVACGAVAIFPGVLFAQAQSMRWPVSDSITRVNYGMDNNSSVGTLADYKCGTRTYDGHRGTDIGVPRNSNVFAAAKGWVQDRADGYGDGFLGSLDGNGFGNHVVLFHNPDYNTIYGHFTAGTGIPAKGDTIQCGARIGASGTSGNSSGPHMHFELRLKVNKTNYYSGAPVDPFSGPCSTPVSYWTKLDTAGVPSTACATPIVAIAERMSSASTNKKSLLINRSASLRMVVPRMEGEAVQQMTPTFYDMSGKFIPMDSSISP